MVGILPALLYYMTTPTFWGLNLVFYGLHRALKDMEGEDGSSGPTAGSSMPGVGDPAKPEFDWKRTLRQIDTICPTPATVEIDMSEGHCK
eukprot:g40272.t1